IVIRDSGRRIAGAPLLWSPEGRSIAFGDLAVSVADGAVCRPLGAGVSIARWLPQGGLAGTTAKGALLVGGAGRPRHAYQGAGGGVFDPSGTRLALGGSRRTLWLLTLATGRRRLLYRSPSEAIGLPVPRAWTSDGRWVLFADDAYGSSSIAADGLPLLAVPSSGGRAVQVEPRVLLADDFVQPCGGDRLVVSAGFDRSVSAPKRVDLVSPPS